MISNTLIAKIGTGIATTGGLGGAGIAYRKEISEFVSPTIPSELKPDGNAYLITKQLKFNESSYSSVVTNFDKKNYYCKIQGESKKISCEVSLVVFDNTKKSVDLKTTLKDLGASKEKKQPFDNATAGSYYKLKLNKVDLDKFDFSSKKTIDIVSDSWFNYKYATLMPGFKVEGGNVVKANNDLLIAIISKKTSTSDTVEAFEKYKCTVDSIITSPAECEIYKFTSDVANSTKISDINFSNSHISKASDTNSIDQITENNFAIVKFNKLSFEDLKQIVKSKVIDFKPYSDASSVVDNKKTYSFTVEEHLYGDLSNDDIGAGVFILG